MIEEVRTEKQIGFIRKYYDSHDHWHISLFEPMDLTVIGKRVIGGDISVTTETIEGLDGVFVGDNLEFLYKEVIIRKCSGCGNKEPLYDEEEKEHYCPICDS